MSLSRRGSVSSSRATTRSFSMSGDTTPSPYTSSRSFSFTAPSTASTVYYTPTSHLSTKSSSASSVLAEETGSNEGTTPMLVVSSGLPPLPALPSDFAFYVPDDLSPPPVPPSMVTPRVHPDLPPPSRPAPKRPSNRDDPPQKKSTGRPTRPVPQLPPRPTTGGTPTTSVLSMGNRIFKPTRPVPPVPNRSTKSRLDHHHSAVAPPTDAEEKQEMKVVRSMTMMEEHSAAAPRRKPFPLKKAHSLPPARLAGSMPAETLFQRHLMEPAGFHKLIEGAVCIKFLFPKYYAKKFTSRERVMINLLLEIAYKESYRLCLRKREIENLLSRGNESEWVTLVNKLTKKQTLSKATGTPSFRGSAAIPSLFRTDYHFTTPEQFEEMMSTIANIKFQCTAYWGKSFSSDEKKWCSLFIDMSLLMRYIKFDIINSLSILLDKKMAKKVPALVSLLHKLDSGSSRAARRPTAPAELIDQIYEHPCFQQETEFKRLHTAAVAYAKVISSVRMRRLIQQIDSIHTLMQNGVLFAPAVRRCFTRDSLRLVYQSTNDVENVRTALENFAAILQWGRDQETPVAS